jgi:hypothetical protein
VGNWDVYTYQPGVDDYSKRHRDLHVTDDRTVRAWLRTEGHGHKTPQPDIKARDALLHMAHHRLLSGIPEVIATFERAALNDELAVWGSCIIDDEHIAAGTEKLRPSYWQHATLDVQSFDFEGMREQDKDFQRTRQKTITTDMGQRPQCRLRVNKKRVLELWPLVSPGGPLG